MTAPTRERCVKLDEDDSLAGFREEFVLPEDVIYLDGNSLGALPKATPERVAHVVEQEWGTDLVASWGAAGWWEQPRTLGAGIAPLVGAGSHEVVVGDSVSVNLFKTLVAALRLNPGRDVLLGEDGNFPTDLYVSQSVAELAGAIERRVDPESSDLGAELATGNVGVVLLSHVDYRTGVLRDMAGLTRLAHRHGALVIWDLCHSVGALPVELGACGADFAVGCTYKYLNAGPGAPAFVFAAERHHAAVRQPLMGWHGHARPFDFSGEYVPAGGASQFLSGAQSLIAAASLEASLDLWRRVDLGHLRAKSLALTEIFATIVADAGFELLTPRVAERRGSQVSVRYASGGPAVVRALEERGIIADVRHPDVLRFGFAPLYLRHVDAYDAAVVLVEVVRSGEWRDPRFAESPVA